MSNVLLILLGLPALGAAAMEEVRNKLAVSLAERITRDRLKREPYWTESLAVGSIEYVEQVKAMILHRSEMEILKDSPHTWVLKESGAPCGQKTDPEIAA